MKIEELYISVILFAVIVVPTLGFIFSLHNAFQQIATYTTDAMEAREILEHSLKELSLNFDATPKDVMISFVDNFTKEVKVRRGTVEYRTLITDIRESEGQSSCRPRDELSVWSRVNIVTTELKTNSIPIAPTDIDVVGSYAYISSNDARASSSDLFIYDVSDPYNMVLVSSIDTGPGIASIAVAGSFVYAAHTSINAQLQIISIEDRFKPRVVSSYKLPGLYSDSTTIGNAVFYKAGLVFLGTQKSQISELFVIDVSLPTSPHLNSSVEIGHGINDIFAFRNFVYVASPHADELKAFTLLSAGLLVPLYNFNDRGSTGNGKRLSFFDSTVYLGKTYTFYHQEVLGIYARTSQKISGIRTASSVQGILAYKNMLVTVQNTDTHNMLFLNRKTLNQLRSPLSLPGYPLAMDCDKEKFFVIYDDKSSLSIIAPI